MQKLAFFFLICLLVGCAKSVSTEDLAKLNGYWEIEKVVFPDGNTKEYSVNPMVDYFQLEGLKGFRKKVQPKFDGTYDTSNDAEPFSIVEDSEGFYMHYDNELSKWQEELRVLNDDNFSVVNEEGVQYDYKRYEPISVQKNE
ncbi:hypothetical protein FGM00_10325 [Aggregatimonas sangjinii]|uniref:Lipocalin-like domain-containing protein n=1 Tax=Aggregatimonas sangjinii TaxID=2583587 RepID=A0A5B7STZ3_9FLAO|nr:hypothetical protein [Aggregatimonas sangjinii]QCX00488.1 hypothetical protein FGM00_10325 [Aggregatimonas sangjinii]